MPVTKPIATVALLRRVREDWGAAGGRRSPAGGAGADVEGWLGTTTLDLLQIGGFCMIGVGKRNGNRVRRLLRLQG